MWLCRLVVLRISYDLYKLNKKQVLFLFNFLCNLKQYGIMYSNYSFSSYLAFHNTQSTETEALLNTSLSVVQIDRCITTMHQGQLNVYLRLPQRECNIVLFITAYFYLYKFVLFIVLSEQFLMRQQEDTLRATNTLIVFTNSFFLTILIRFKSKDKLLFVII